MKIKGTWLDEKRLIITVPNTFFWLGADFLVWMVQNRLEFDIKPDQLMKEAATKKGNKLILKMRLQQGYENKYMKNSLKQVTKK